jgi:hypothetical protein
VFLDEVGDQHRWSGQQRDHPARCCRWRMSEGVANLLVNNAGVMGPPVRRTTADGFEL